VDPLIHSFSRGTTALASVSSVYQLFSFLVVCSGRLSSGFGFMTFFASVKSVQASSLQKHKNLYFTVYGRREHSRSYMLKWNMAALTPLAYNKTN
jgi:hypothetical protein